MPFGIVGGAEFGTYRTYFIGVIDHTRRPSRSSGCACMTPTSIRLYFQEILDLLRLHEEVAVTLPRPGPVDGVRSRMPTTPEDEG